MLHRSILLGQKLMQELKAGPAQGLGKLGLGLRPHQKTKIFLEKKAPLFIVKGPNFYKTIYIFSKGCTFFLLVMLRILQILLLAYKLSCY